MLITQNAEVARLQDANMGLREQYAALASESTGFRDAMMHNVQQWSERHNEQARELKRLQKDLKDTKRVLKRRTLELRRANDELKRVKLVPPLKRQDAVFCQQWAEEMLRE